ncbi:MAG: phosphomannomutase/phosphoglucomutase [Candidatus Nanohaloarchaea archaeon]|jgi:phosphomannomutase/phosphoglucomutase
MVSFFHAYDLRGKYPDEIGQMEAEKVGKAFGTVTDADEVLVGRDGRTHGKEITEAFIQGVKSTGVNVVDAGMVPSPVIYYAMRERGVKASAVVTASHNPPEYTGFKFCKENALAMSREGGMKEIEQIYISEDFDKGKGSKTEIDVSESYIEAIQERFEMETGLDVAVNFGNGVTADIGGEVLEAIGCDVEAVNNEIDGDFPNHLPDPTNNEAKKALERKMTDEDLGIIFDGDGDRAGFILPEHGYIPEDEVLALFSQQCLEKEKGKVVHDLRASKLVPEKIREFGGEPVETKVGHTFISESIHSDEEIVFAGELSGHYYFPVYGFPFDDGIFAAALMCFMVSRKDVRDILDNYPDYPVSPELRIDCPEEAKEKVVSDIKDVYSDHDVSTIDGAKIIFENGWALVRPSNTEEKMSVRCEGDTESDVEKILNEVETEVRNLIKKYS